MNGVRFWIVLLALCIGSSLNSCAVSDGPFETVSGSRIDAAILKGLEARRATIAEVIAALGPPTEKVDRARTQEVLVYQSVRERKSRESIGGFQISESAQRFIEVWELKFTNGALQESQLSSRVEER